MMVQCAVYGCSNRSSAKSKRQTALEKSLGTNVTFHKLPSDPELRQEWIRRINRKDFPKSNEIFVCSVHFEKNCIERKGSLTHLAKNAYPTIFPTMPVSSQVPIKIPRLAPTERTIAKATDSFNAQLVIQKTLFGIAKRKISFPPPPNQSNNAPAFHDLPSSSGVENEPLHSSSEPLFVEIQKPQSVNSGGNLPEEATTFLCSSQMLDASADVNPVSSPERVVTESVISASETLFPNFIKPRCALPEEATTSSYSSQALKSPISHSFNHSQLVTEIRESSPEPSIFQYDKDFPSQEPDTPRKRKLKQSLSKLYKQLQKKLADTKSFYQKKVKNLQAKIRRRNRRGEQQKDIISKLKASFALNHEQAEALRTLPEWENELLTRQLNKKLDLPVQKKYGDNLRAFALTLNYYSPKAYEYVRDKFDKSLPHSSRLYEWYKSVNAKPGFLSEPFAVLKEMSSRSENPLYGCLIFDEMAIRKQVQLVGTRYVGYEDLGTGLDSDDRPEASEALFFMLVGLNASWKLPVGYFLISSITGVQKAHLVSDCLRHADSAGIRVKTLTCDGPSANFAMGTELGCNFEDVDSDRAWFEHPVTSERIYFFFDNCHMIKLVRNLLATYIILYDPDGKRISWTFIVKLHELQEKEGLHLANRLRITHIKYHNKIMKVSLAVQTISDSVADGMEVCLELDLEEFEGCEATVKFLRIFNNLFDIGNSKNLYDRCYKKPVSATNFDHIKNYLHDAVVYIKGLKLSDKKTPLLNSKRKTGPIGFIIMCKNIINLYVDLCVNSTSPLKFIMTYKWSQDHMEMYFCVLRMKENGYNNNPNALQLESNVKRTLVHHELKVTSRGNCIPLEAIPILNCSKAPERAINSTTPRNRCVQADEQDMKICDVDFNFVVLSDFQKNVSTHIAGFVIKALRRTLKCEDCLFALIAFPVRDFCNLIRKKNRGGLITPSTDVVKIINCSEKLLQSVITVDENGRKLVKKPVSHLVSTVMSNFFPESNIFPTLDDHSLDSTTISDHKYLLVKSIALKYIATRVHFICKNIHDKSISKRQVFNKLILFKGH